MRVTKPSWVKHSDEKERRSPIYSISVHPDGTRLATGGLDRQVKVWSTVPILDGNADVDEANHKLLCTMTAHNGSVLSVRWAHHGRFLASGSDDMVVVIWGIDPSGGGSVFGSTDVNVENWKALTRLVGHTADIIDIAWSRDDSMLASVGLDNKVYIWDGYSFDRLHRIDQHADFVKGVCWDPVGEFLATQSDDKTVKIWKTSDWSLAHSIDRPFARSPKSTFFRRLSWSPDGAFVAASNAMNGPIFVAAIIDREEFGSNISFVGHANTIQVAAFNPRLLIRPGEIADRAHASCMLALGSDDFSISIWRNTLHKPLVVLHDVFNGQLYDLCWANDGHHLYGCSADGTVCAVSFDPAEVPDLAGLDKTQMVLQEYGYTPPHTSRPQRSFAPVVNGFGAAPNAGAHVNVLQPKKGKPNAGKKRIDLSRSRNTLTPPSSATRSAQQSSSLSSAPHDPFADAPIQSHVSPATAQASTAQMFNDARNAFANQNGESPGPSKHGSEKKKAGLMDGESARIPKGRTMGPTQMRASEIKEIRAPRVAIAGGSGETGRLLPLPRIQTELRIRPIDSSDPTLYLEARNAEDPGRRHTVTMCQGGQNQWIDFVPSAVMSMTMTERFCAAGCEDGSVIVYSPAGRHLSTTKLEAPCSEMAARSSMLMTVTANYLCRVTNTRSGKALLPSTRISHLLVPPSAASMPPPQLEISKIDVRTNGLAIIITTEPAVFAFDPASSAWIPLVSPWYLEMSPMADKRSRPGSAGPLAELEAEVVHLRQSRSAPTGGDLNKPQWFDEATEMGHLESRMKAAELLESKEEYKFWLARYASTLGREGFRARAEELIKDLVGPIYHHHGQPGWNTTVVGLSKRELARTVLSTLAQSTALSGLAQHWQGVLKAVSAEEAAL